MAWVMTSKRDGADISYYIGAVKIANVHLIPTSTDKKWIAHLRFMDSEPSGQTYASVSEAMKALHQHLNSPPPEEPLP